MLVDEKKTVSVVFSCDQNYVPHLGVLLMSILHHASADRKYEFFVLDGGIACSNKKLLEEIIIKYGRIFSSISFFDMHDLFKDFYLRAHFSSSIYYRLMIPSMFTAHKKILYLDVDMVVLEDIAQLYDKSLNEKALGACITKKLFRETEKDQLMLEKNITYGEYITQHLGIKESNIPFYFNSGVLLFNLEKIRSTNIMNDIIEDLKKNKYYYPDQDVLNKFFYGDVEFIDEKWNVSNYCVEDKEFNSLCLIHFIQKPWTNLDAPLAYLYFHYLRQTPWYEQVIFSLHKAEDKRKNKKKNL